MEPILLTPLVGPAAVALHIGEVLNLVAQEVIMVIMDIEVILIMEEVEEVDSLVMHQNLITLMPEMVVQDMIYQISFPN